MPIYGHFGQGCIHTRISYDMRSVEGVRAYREFIERAADIVLEFGGSLSGEHGDGQSRGALLPKMFGPELMEAFREFKALWDPENHMNPGKMMGTPDDPRIYQPEEKLRVGPGYEAARPHTHFTFPDDDGAFSHATMRCVGVGACRKTNGGTMCPSYMATREEKHSTRGRAHLLWELMQSESGNSCTTSPTGTSSPRYSATRRLADSGSGRSLATCTEIPSSPSSTLHTATGASARRRWW